MKNTRQYWGLFKRVIQILGCMSLLSGCLLLPSAQMKSLPPIKEKDKFTVENETSNTWIGVKISEYIMRYKPPVNVTPDGNGGQIYAFLEQRRYTNGYEHLVDVQNDYRYYFVNSKGIIYAWKYIDFQGTNWCFDRSGICRNQINEEEHDRKIKLAAATWIGKSVQEYMDFMKNPKNRDPEATFFSQKNSKGNTIIGLTYDEDSTKLPGPGYIRFYADKNGIIYGWDSVFRGRKHCQTPNAEGICTR